MTTDAASPTAPPPVPSLQIDGEEHRLHAWSWLFVTLQHMKQFIVPLVVLLFAGRGDRNELWPLIGVGVLALASVWEYFTYRYRLMPDRIEIRSGLLERKLRQITYARIHNVALHQTLLHRIFNVAEVRLESAGGMKPEAEMRVLRFEKAIALEKLVRERGGEAASLADDGTRSEAASTTLLALPTAEVIRHGLISNRGLVLVAGGFAAMSQVSPRLFANVSERWLKAGTGYAESHQFGWLDYGFAVLSLLAVFVIALRVLSVVASLLQYHGFTLSETGRRLTVSRGLLTRLRTSSPKRRIQAWTLRESVLHRLFKRRALSIDTAASQSSGQQQQRGLRELAPIATPAACDDLIRHFLPNEQWPPHDWQPLHRLAWLRIWLGDVLWVLPVTAALFWRFGAWGALLLLWLPWSALLAWKAATNAGWSLDGRLVAIRRGWWSRQWRFAEVEKLQALQVSRSPLDRLFGMRGMTLDTAGANAISPTMQIAYLTPEAAEKLQAVLSKRLARSALRW